MKKEATATGTIKFLLTDADGNVKHTLLTVDVSALETSYTLQWGTAVVEGEDTDGWKLAIEASSLALEARLSTTCSLVKW